MSMPSVSAPSAFDFKPTSWQVWIKRFERYISVAGLTEKSNKEKVDLLCYTMGNKAEDILNQVLPNVTGDTTFKEVKEAFDGYFAPKKNIIFERFKFNSRVQQADESVDSFITALHKLTETCEYNMLKSELIRDRLVIGVRDPKTSERLQLTADARKSGDHGAPSRSSGCSWKTHTQ